MSVEILNPFDSYRAQSGAALDMGKLYVGVANLDPQTNPIAVFYDEALTIAAPQPLATSGGYVWRNGSPARIFTHENIFSIKLLDKNNVQIFYAASVSDANKFDIAKALSGRPANILDFAGGIPIENGELHELGDYYPTLLQAEAAFPAAPIAEAAVLRGGDWQGLSAAWAAAWCAGASTYNTIDVADGHYVFNAPLILRTENQHWMCSPNGRQHPFARHNPSCYFEFIGSGVIYRTVMTRRNYRGSSSDPADTAMVACVQIENRRIKFMPNVVCEYNQAWADSHPNDLIGGDPLWDIGIFVGCRQGVDLSDAGAIGHHRVANLYVDLTRSEVPELSGWDGVQHPVTPEYGADGLCLDRAVFAGGRWRYRLSGANFKAGLNSYGKDYLLFLDATFSGQPTTGDTLTLAELTFTFKETPIASQDVLIGVDVTDTLNNLKALADEISELGDISYPQFNAAEFIVSTNKITVIDNANRTGGIAGFTASKSSSVITLSGATPTTQPDPAPYYDSVSNALYSDGRGGFGLSDFRAIGTIFSVSSYLDARRVYADIRSDMDHLLETDSSGAVWLDAPAANSSRKAWGQRFIGCRFTSFDPFIVRLDRIARVTFLDCHTEPSSAGGIKDLAGNPDPRRYGSYTNTENSLSICLEGANATPDGDFYTYNQLGSVFFRPNSGRNVLGGSLRTHRELTVGQGSDLADPASMYLFGGGAQNVFFGNETKKDHGRITYRISTGGYELYATGSDNVLTRLLRVRRTTLTETTLDGATGQIFNVTSDKTLNVTAAEEVRIIAGAASAGYLRCGSTVVASWSASFFLANKPFRPDVNGSVTNTLGTNTGRWGLCFFNDVRFKPSASVALTQPGELTIETVSNTQVRIKLLGSDSVERSVVLTLA